jgi:hypothetical protein
MGRILGFPTTRQGGDGLNVQHLTDSGRGPDRRRQAAWPGPGDSRQSVSGHFRPAFGIPPIIDAIFNALGGPRVEHKGSPDHTPSFGGRLPFSWWWLNKLHDDDYLLSKLDCKNSLTFFTESASASALYSSQWSINRTPGVIDRSAGALNEW